MKTYLLKFAFFSAAAFILSFSAASNYSQTPAVKAELSVAGFRLGDEETAKTTLQNYSPRYDNELKQPKYYFYNEYGTQVMAITTLSRERPFLVVGIEVFAVGESYLNKHFQLKEFNSFGSGLGFFIGEKPSATSLIFAVANVTGAKEVIKKLGAPEADEKADKIRTLRYRISEVNDLKAGEAKSKGVNFGAYSAQYRFVKNRLRRFSIAVEAMPTAKNL
jgi:hypothetical protein